MDFPGGAVVKNLPANVGDARFDPWVGKVPWRRTGLPSPVFLLQNPMDRGAWPAIVHGAPKSQT